MKHTTFSLLVSLIVSSILFMSAAAFAEDPSFSTGPAEMTDPGLFDCGPQARTSAVGKITSDDGKTWIMPAETAFLEAAKATDLYNACNDVTPDNLSSVDTSSIPLIDAGGSEEFTAYLFADNYFELYVNGQLLAVDPVPFTPFNSSIVRFKADRPVTLAIKMVDWEENLGLGSEKGRGSGFHPGDGGLVAHVMDAARDTVLLTDETWRAQTYYISPLKDRSCLNIDGPLRDSSACDMSAANDGTSFSAAHWKLPKDWMNAEFNDAAWPMATTFSNEIVGVGNKPSYTNFTEIFDAPDADATFIWSSNLILDNVVLLRKTID